MLTLSETFAIYAGGRYGVIEEMYVRPAFREKGVGRALLERAATLAADRGWRRLEVTAPEDDPGQRSGPLLRTWAASASAAASCGCSSPERGRAPRRNAGAAGAPGAVCETGPLAFETGRRVRAQDTRRRMASQYFSRVFPTTSAGSAGAGGSLFHLMDSR